MGNDTEGVTLEVEGRAAEVARFLTRLRDEAPPMARVDAVMLRDIHVEGGSEFRILASQVVGQVHTGIPADAATCPDCLHELFDRNDRRFGYPFINCTNCGPRFTITRRSKVHLLPLPQQQ